MPVPTPIYHLVERRVSEFYPSESPSAVLFRTVERPRQILGPAAVRQRFHATEGEVGHRSIAFRSLHTTRTAVFVVRNNALHRAVSRLNRISISITIQYCRHIIPEREHSITRQLTLRCLPTKSPTNVGTRVTRGRRRVSRLQRAITKLQEELRRLRSSKSKQDRSKWTCPGPGGQGARGPGW